MDDSLHLTPSMMDVSSKSRPSRGDNNNFEQSAASILTLKMQHGLQEPSHYDENTFVGSDESSFSDYSDSDSDVSGSEYDFNSCISLCSDNSLGSFSDDDDMDELEKDLLNFDLTRRRASTGVVPTKSPALRALEQSARARGGRQSMPCLPSHIAIQERMRRAEANNSYFQSPESILGTSSTEEADKYETTRPADFIKYVLEGVTYATIQDKAGDYFLPVTRERVAAHSLKVSQAMRKGDLKTLRKLAQKGAPLDSCNPQGESMPHLACRMNNTELIEFLLQEAKISFRVRDDSGRTPFHDSCWTTSPNFDIVKLLVRDSPELLFVEDKRGFAPLQYIPKQCWSDWNHFFENQRSFLRLSVQYSGFTLARDQLQQTQKRLQALVESQLKYSQEN